MPLYKKESQYRWYAKQTSTYQKRLMRADEEQEQMHLNRNWYS